MPSMEICCPRYDTIEEWENASSEFSGKQICIVGCLVASGVAAFPGAIDLITQHLCCGELYPVSTAEGNPEYKVIKQTWIQHKPFSAPCCKMIGTFWCKAMIGAVTLGFFFPCKRVASKGPITATDGKYGPAVPPCGKGDDDDENSKTKVVPSGAPSDIEMVR